MRSRRKATLMDEKAQPGSRGALGAMRFPGRVHFGPRPCGALPSDGDAGQASELVENMHFQVMQLARDFVEFFYAVDKPVTGIEALAIIAGPQGRNFETALDALAHMADVAFQKLDAQAGAHEQRE